MELTIGSPLGVTDGKSKPNGSTAMPRYIAPLTQNLMTLEGLREGLAALGVRWKAEVYEHENPPLTNGLYVWATGEGVILHIGTAWHEDGLGLTHVLPTQIAAAGQPDFIHGHALAIQRLKGRGTVLPYAGELTTDDSCDISWLEAVVGQLNDDFSPDERSDMLKTAAQLRARPYKQAERFAVRLSMYLGDTGAPLNHTYKNALTTGRKRLTRTLDYVAVIVAARLHGTLGDLHA